MQESIKEKCMSECKYNEIGDFCEHPANRTGVCSDDVCPIIN